MRKTARAADLGGPVSMATPSTRTNQERDHADLVRRLQQGDEGVLEDLLVQLGPRVVAGLRLRFPALRAGDREDLLVEALARLWQARRDFDPAGNLPGYLFTIAANGARDVLRSGMHQA